MSFMSPQQRIGSTLPLSYIELADRLSDCDVISNGKYEELLLDAFRADMVYNLAAKIRKRMIEPFFLDTDCLSTFLIVQRENLISSYTPVALASPQVYDELKKVPFMKNRVDALLGANRVVLYQIVAGTDLEPLPEATEHPDRGNR